MPSFEDVIDMEVREMREASAIPADAAVTDDEMVARAGALREFLAQEASAGEQRRSLTDAAFDALREAGIFKLGAPRCWGGADANMRTTALTLSELTRGDASAGWFGTILWGGASLTRMLPEQAQEDVWGVNPMATISGSLAPAGAARKVVGGHILTGTWAFNSTCLHADWAILGTNAADDNGNGTDPMLALVPYSDLTIEDTWYVAGMRGTGSNTVVATDVFVADHRVAPLAVIDEIRAGFFLSMPAALLGSGRAALDLTRKVMERDRPITGSFYERPLDCPGYQLNFATAMSKVDTAYLHILRACEDVDLARTEGRVLDQLGYARLRMDMSVALGSLREAISLCLSIGGTGSFAEKNPMQRVWRDFETASRHGFANATIGHELYARALFDLQPMAL